MWEKSKKKFYPQITRGQYSSKPNPNDWDKNCCLGWKMKFWDNKLNTLKLLGQKIKLCGQKLEAM